MYLSSSEIALGHQHTLNNFQTASAACVSASERLTDLFMRLSRSQIDHLARQQPGLPSSGLWLSGIQSQSAVLLGELLHIIGDTQQTVIIAAAAQTRVLDNLLVTTLERARNTSPVEVLPAISSLKQSIEQTEQTLSSWADAARQSVALLENRFGQLTGTPGEEAPAAAEAAAPAGDEAEAGTPETPAGKASSSRSASRTLQ